MIWHSMIITFCLLNQPYIFECTEQKPLLQFIFFISSVRALKCDKKKNLFSWFSWYFSSQCLLVGAINLILCFPVVLSTSLLTLQLSKFIFFCYCTLNLAVVCFFFLTAISFLTHLAVALICETHAYDSWVLFLLKEERFVCCAK